MGGNVGPSPTSGLGVANPFAQIMARLSPVPLPGVMPSAPQGTRNTQVDPALPVNAPVPTEAQASAQNPIAAASPAVGGQSPSARAASAYNYYIQQGLSPQAAAGIVGNFQQESAFRTDVLSGHRKGDAGRSGFAGQWNGKRANNLIAFAKSRGEATPSFKTQLDFAMEEGNPNSPYADAGAVKAFQLMRNAQTPQQASNIFRQYFERPSAQDAGSRAKYAANIYGAKGDPTLVAEAFGGDGSSTMASATPTAPANRYLSKMFGDQSQTDQNSQQQTASGSPSMQMAQSEAPQVGPVQDEAGDYLAQAKSQRQARNQSAAEKAAQRRQRTADRLRPKPIA